MKVLIHEKRREQYSQCREFYCAWVKDLKMAPVKSTTLAAATGAAKEE
jgi:hypothetical protein